MQIGDIIADFLQVAGDMGGKQDGVVLFLDEFPEQVQDFYPTPGTLSTCMYHTGLDPRTMEPVYVPKSAHEKELQRALLQWKRPEKRRLVMEALHRAGRGDLVGYGPDCLLRPVREAKDSKPSAPAKGAGRGTVRGGKRPGKPSGRGKKK